MGLASKVLLTAVSAAATVYASGCSVSATTTIKTGSDATALASCSSFTGSILIEEGASSGGTLSLDGIKKIDGTFTYNNDDNLQTFSMGDLQEISDTFTLQNLSSLSTITLTSLSQTGNIVFSGLGRLGALGFGGLQEVADVSIINTQIADLTGLNNVSKIDGFKITDNPLLNNITFPNVEELSSIIIGPNDVAGDTGVTLSMPKLTSAEYIEVRNCSVVDLSAIENVSNELELLGNTFQNFTAKALTWVGGLVINDNTALMNMSFPALAAVNGSNSTLNVANNTKLMHIAGFSNLRKVNGDVSLAGNFSDLSFPHLGSIGGALTIDTASSTFDCSTLPQKGSQIVAGSTTCHIGDKTKIGGSSTGTASVQGSSSFALPHEIPSSFMPIFPLIAGLLFA